MFRLSIKDIVELHNEIVKRYGGELGLLNEGNLAFIVDQINGEVYEGCHGYIGGVEEKMVESV